MHTSILEGPALTGSVGQCWLINVTYSYRYLYGGKATSNPNWRREESCDCLLTKLIHSCSLYHHGTARKPTASGLFTTLTRNARTRADHSGGREPASGSVESAPTPRVRDPSVGCQ